MAHSTLTEVLAADTHIGRRFTLDFIIYILNYTDKLHFQVFNSSDFYRLRLSELIGCVLEANNAPILSENDL